MTFVNLLFFSRVQVVNPDPGIFGGSGYEAVSEEGMERSRSDGVGKVDGHWGMLSGVKLAIDFHHVKDAGVKGSGWQLDVPQDIQEMDLTT